MKNIYKLISLFLTVLMLLSAFSVLFTVGVYADDAVSTVADEEDATTSGKISIEDYTTQIYATPEEKLATMELFLEKGSYRLYVDRNSGEVACVNTVTGEKIFTNPYDVGASTGNDATKQEILSQIIVQFTDHQGQLRTFTSFQEAAVREQINVEPIKNGLRIEYTIGREQSKTLVPRLITYERFMKMIYEPALEAFGDELYSDPPSSNEVHQFQRFLTYFVLYSKESFDWTKEERKNMEYLFGGVYDGLINSDKLLSQTLAKYGVVDRMPVFVFAPDASEAQLAMCEEMVLTYCSDYTYEELEYDHALTEYESEDENPPVFRMALEYKLDDQGLTVRLPANGIRFNETLYTLTGIEVLPYMGAGNSGYSGYNFFPDGSGALFDFEDLNTTQTRAVLGTVYGTDFAYHDITGKYQKTIRYPVFGIVEDTTYYTYSNIDVDSGNVISQQKISGAIVEAVKDYEDGKDTRVFKGKVGTLVATYGEVINDTQLTEEKVLDKGGFVAIIEEGDALTSLTTYHAGSLSDYNTIKMKFTPRPKDTYNLKDSISVGSDDEWTVVSKRKYVGGYKIRYIMLSEAGAKENTKTYDASWFGMAVAYRDYLTNNGVISKIDSDKLTDDIPLYIETFGTVETIEKILSVPVTVKAPLTTFDNIVEMYNDLADQGIKNINFKLTGYANGGMYSTIPAKLKFEKAVGGNKGFQKLLDTAAGITAADEDSRFGIFPDFDIAYSAMDTIADGYSPSKHAAKTIDDRYANKREYSATQQKYINYYNIVISPAYFSVFYDKLVKNYANKYNNITGVSVSTLGYALNSDFDEDEPYNREDSKSFTVKALDHFDKTYGEVMTDGGNAYVWKYVDHILDMSLDSSRYNFSSNAVPFIGVVLHGSVSFAGEPLNMEGDIQYAMLKAIENGASPYFILSYQNTQALKEYYDLSQYYSIRYDIWKNDIADVYNTLNNVLYDVQDKYITNHEFLEGNRVPDADELEADILAEYQAKLEAEKNAAEILQKELTFAANEARENGRIAEAFAAEAVIDALEAYTSQMESANLAMTFSLSGDYYGEAVRAYRALEALRSYAQYRGSDDASEAALYEQFSKAEYILSAVTDYNWSYDEALAKYDALVAAHTAKIAEITLDQSVGTLKNRLQSYYTDLARGEDVTKYTDPTSADYQFGEYSLEQVIEIVTDYNRYTAAENAYKLVMENYFMHDYEECFEIYFEVEETSYFSRSSYAKLAIEDGASEEVIANAERCYKANQAKKALEARNVKPVKGNVDNYLVALAQMSVMKELGYADSSDETLVNLYKRALNAVNRTRSTAINDIARLDGANLRSLKTLLETAEEYLALTVAGIEVIAGVEGNVIVRDNESDEFYAVKNESELSFITLQAIERARNVNKYIEQLTESESFVEIPEGKQSDVEWNGKKLMFNKNANGEKIYFYGTRESGYTYFTLSADGELELYLHGNPSGRMINGLNVYEAVIDGKSVAYTADMENGYTYYVANVDYYGSASSPYYMIADAVVRNGEEFRTLSDGTVIYKEMSSDGSVIYYSVDENGAYTLYEYRQSIRAYYDSAASIAKQIRDIAAEKTVLGDDASFDEAVQSRIDRNNVIREEVVEEEEVEEYSRYATENIVAVTYGSDNGDPYKTIILNYNNYTVTVVYNDIEYTIPAYEFVVIKR